MNNDFFGWLAENNLTEAFTTNAGDTLYVNVEKKFGVLKKLNVFALQSFYLDDIIEFKTYDDEHVICEWNCMGTWRFLERVDRYSTGEVYMKIVLRNSMVLRVSIYKAVNGKINRQSNDHINLFNYACGISQIVYNCATGRSPQQ